MSMLKATGNNKSDNPDDDDDLLTLDSDEDDLFKKPNLPNQEDEEDLFIASQSITDKSQKKIPDQAPKIPDQSQKIPDNKSQNCEVSIGEGAKKTNEMAMLETLAKHKSWTYALDDMGKRFLATYMDTALLQTYTLNYYFKKFFEYDLLMRSDDSGLPRKLPMLCVWIKEITRKPTSATVFLTDFKEEIRGTILSSFVKDKTNWSYLMIGSVLFLKDVVLLKVNNNKNCYHLNININNIVSIYYPDLDANSVAGGVKKLNVQSLDSLEVDKLVDEFENLYTKYEYKPNESILMNKTNGLKSLNKSVNSNTKPAPYRIPPHLTKNSNSNNKTVNKPPVSSLKSSSFMSKPSGYTKPSNRVGNGQVPQLNPIVDLQANDSDGDDLDMFFAAEKSQVQASSTQITQEIPEKTNALSEAIFSQLMSGCDDAFFNDDD